MVTKRKRDQFEFTLERNIAAYNRYRDSLKETTKLIDEKREKQLIDSHEQLQELRRKKRKMR